MMVKEVFNEYSNLITEELNKFLDLRFHQLNEINSWPLIIKDHLKLLSNSGKMIRGGLFLHTYKTLTGDITPQALKVAVAIELSQTAILMHDDIIDRDSSRRGVETFHIWFNKKAKENNIKNSEHLGNGQSICLGDICFFLTFELLSQSGNFQIIEEFSKEFSRLGFAEMGDVFLPKKEIELEDILNIYKHKTAGYTFVLPIKLAYVLANINSNEFEDYCYNLGMIFQIKDDYLGLFGDEKTIGKPVGSDIIEGKKTIFYFYLPEDYKKYFGKKITKNELKLIQDHILTSGIKEKVDLIIKDLEEKTRLGLDNMRIKDNFLYSELIEYNLNRNK